MNARTPFVSQIQATKSMQPGQGALDDPARAPEAAAMGPAAFGQLAGDPAAIELVAMRLRIIARGRLGRARVSARADPAGRATAECRPRAAAAASRRAGSPT